MKKISTALAAVMLVPLAGFAPANSQVFEDLGDGLSGGGKVVVNTVTTETEAKKTSAPQAEATAVVHNVHNHYHSTKRVVSRVPGGLSKADIGRLENKIDGLNRQFTAASVAAQNAAAKTAAVNTPPPSPSKKEEGWWWVLLPTAALALAAGWWWGAARGAAGLKDPNRAPCGSFDPQGVPQGWGRFRTNTTRDGSMLEATSEQVAITEAEARAEVAHAAALERAARAAERRQERAVARRLLADPSPAEPAGGWQAGPGPAATK